MCAKAIRVYAEVSCRSSGTSPSFYENDEVVFSRIEVLHFSARTGSSIEPVPCGMMEKIDLRNRPVDDRECP
jgi:hypothetical protein